MCVSINVNKNRDGLTTPSNQSWGFRASRAALITESKVILRHKHICFNDIMRTTIEIRDDIYKKIIKEHGKRKISVAINEILSKYFSRKRKDMFGADPWLKKVDLSDLRDEYERNV